MSEPCDCGWCGNCRDQLEHERYVEDLRGYGVPSWKDEQQSICGNGCSCDTYCMFPEG